MKRIVHFNVYSSYVIHMWPISHRIGCSLDHISLECPNNNSLMLRPTWNWITSHFLRFLLPVISWNPQELTHKLHRAALYVVCYFVQLLDCGPVLQSFVSYLLGSWEWSFLCHYSLFNCYDLLRFVEGLVIYKKNEKLRQIIFF